MFLSRLKIGTRLGLAFAVVLIMVVGIVWLAVWRLESLDTLLTEVVDNRVPQVVISHKWAISVLESGRHMRNIFILDHDSIPEELAGLEEQKKMRIQYMNDLEKTLDTDAGRHLWNNVAQARALYIPDEDEFIRLARLNQLDEPRDC
ncbi:MAG: methyl-accepting chemotaxis protein [Gammaproteobacteria bacterium]|nr:methyl-accepting chemotaxis protein [Gammaproteobacteria bacterium]